MPREKNEATRKVLAYYRLKPGQLMHYSDAATDLEMPKEHVNAALSRAHARHPEMGIRREGMAGHYVYRANLVKDPEPPKEDKTMYYERVGMTSDGAIVVRDENGRLYKLADQL